MARRIAARPLLLLWGWLALINAVEFFIMGMDKRRAVRRRRRVPEATLFPLALLGGSAGGILGMLCFRHKTRHRRFVVGFPLILLLQTALLALALFQH